MNLYYDDKQLCIAILANSLDPPKLVATLIIKGTFEIMHNSIAIFSEEPDLLSGDLHKDDELNNYLIYASDFVPHKPRTDVLLMGSAYSPKGQPTDFLQTVLQIGSLKKVLDITGDRIRQENFSGGLSFYDPHPFVKMPLTYTKSYGGNGFGKNPVGLGHQSIKMPNIVTQAGIPRRTKDDNEPGGYTPLNATWEQRSRLVGLYDKKWLNDRWPWFPQDFDWGYFNSAPSDQQISGYLQGNENITLHNLHPDHSVYKTSLPGIRVRCFINEALNNHKHIFQEVPVNLDTLLINMDQEKLNLVWRGQAEVRTLKLKEINDVFVVAEALSDEPKSLEYYWEFLQVYKKKEDYFQESPEDEENKAAFDKKFIDMEKKLTAMGKLLSEAKDEAENVITQVTKSLSEQKCTLVSQDITPDITEKLSATGSLFLEPVDVLYAINRLKNNPDSPAYTENIDPDSFEKAMSEAELLEKEKAELEKEFSEGKKVVWTREKVKITLQNRGSLVEQDLAQLDLSELDLSGEDLSGAILFCANLQRAKLVGTNLSKANLNKADLAGANLADAVLDEADLTSASLTDTILVGLSLNSTTLAGLYLAEADFSKSIGKNTNFSACDLTNANFSESQLPQADFTNSKLDGANFKMSQLQAAQFCGVTASRIIMDNADITGLHGNEGAKFSGGSFRSVRGEGVIFEGAILDRTDFSGSILIGSQFSGAFLCDAVFDQVQASSSVFDDSVMQRVTITRSNMLRSTFDRADITNANLQASNFFEAGFWQTVIKGVKFHALNLKNTLLSEL